MSAVLAFLVSASTALSISHPPDLTNTTISSLPAPPSHNQNLTFSPWPPRPYQVTLNARFARPDLVIISVEPFYGTRSVSVPGLQDFLREFADNLERNYPIPGKVPRFARQSFPDIESYTIWRMDFNEGLMGNRLPTEWALLALDEIGRQLGRFGPGSVFFSIKDRSSTYSYGFLTITEFGDPSMHRFLAIEKGIFQTT